MAETKGSTSSTADSEPTDPNRCQAERRMGGPFSFGPPAMRRCDAAPKWIAVERKPDAAGFQGGMSLCDTCRAILEEITDRPILFLPLAEARS